MTGQYAAVKIVPKNAILNSRMSISEAGAKSDKILLGIEREIVIMKLIDHPNVMNLFDVWETNGELCVTPSSSPRFFPPSAFLDRRVLTRSRPLVMFAFTAT